MQNARPYLSVIIPAHNEERRLAACLDRWLDYLWDSHYTYEIVIVANGCTDGTVQVCKRYRNDHEHVTWYEQALRGKGLAVRTGMLMSHGAWRYMADVDLSCPPEQLVRFIGAACEGDTYPIVIGSREILPMTDTTLKRRVMGRVYHALVRAILPEIQVRDTQCGFKLFRDEVVNPIFRKTKLDGLAFDAEVLYLAFRLKYPVYELGVPWTHDPDSRVRLVHDSWRMLHDLTHVKRLHQRPKMPRRRPAPEEVPAD